MAIAKNNRPIRRYQSVKSMKSVKRTSKKSVHKQKTLPKGDTFWPGRNFHKEFDSKCTAT